MKEDVKKCLHKAMRLCSTKEMCRSEVLLKLEKWDVLAEDQEEILAVLEAEKFVSDVRYARSYVHDKFQFNKWGRMKIRAYLKQKEISESTISEALKQIAEDDYQIVLTEILRKKNKQLKEDDSFKRKQKLLSHAQSKGFEAEVSYQVLAKLAHECR